MAQVTGARKLAATVRLEAHRRRQLRPDTVRILVVDDEPKLVAFVSRALTAQGFKVDGVTDGGRALELIQTHDYELVVLDLMMRGVDGVTVLERAIEARPHLPVLVLSALSDVESKVRCFGLGAVDYMTKPFALAELRARIWARLEPADDGAEPVLTGDRLVLDVERRVAETPRGTVRLSDREFLLLRHLMRRQGEVCSRAELLEAVWGCSFDPRTNVVDVYVRRLRAKLGPSVIATVRNVGYLVRST
jgi:two-component system copper resistance phosphate regulon response regulator CusR